jgi:sec-independent protein translocase protein TatB
VFDVAFSELVVIGILALIVLGPKRLPEVARTAGSWMGKVRNFVESAKRDMNTELRRDELAELRQVKDQLIETKNAFEQVAVAANPLATASETPAPSIAPPPASAPKPATRKRPAVKKKKKSVPVKARRAKPHGRSKR